jgi:hypothetical protein
MWFHNHMSKMRVMMTCNLYIPSCTHNTLTRKFLSPYYILIHDHMCCNYGRFINQECGPLPTCRHRYIHINWFKIYVFTILFGCCFQKNEELLWHWLGASFMVLGYSSTWRMRGCPLELAGFSKLYLCCSRWSPSCFPSSISTAHQPVLAPRQWSPSIEPLRLHSGRTVLCPPSLLDSWVVGYLEPKTVLALPL